MNYKKQLVSFPITKISLLSVVLFAVPCAAGLLVNLLWMKRPFLLTSAFYWDLLIIFAVFLIGLVAHEGIHAIFAMLIGKVKKEDLAFGANPRQLMLYCHVKTPLSVSAYRLMLLPPVLITGLIPLVLSAFLGSSFLVVVFSLLVSGGAGDLMMLFSLRKYDREQLVVDHPEAPAYYLVYPEDALPEDFVEVTEEQEADLKKMMENKDHGATGGKNNLLKILIVLLFSILTVLGVFLVACFMKFF